MSLHSIFTIPDFATFASIIHSFIKTNVGGVPVITGFCRYSPSSGLQLLEWHWNTQCHTKQAKTLLSLLKKTNQEASESEHYVIIFESYMQNLLQRIVGFVNKNHFFGNHYTTNHLFILEMDIKIARIGANVFHHDGGDGGGNIDIIGFSYLRSKDLFQDPDRVPTTDITLVIPNQGIQKGTIVAKSDQADYRQRSITKELREDQILLFNNHRYLHAAPQSIPTCPVLASDRKCSRTIMVRFSITRR